MATVRQAGQSNNAGITSINLLPDAGTLFHRAKIIIFSWLHFCGRSPRDKWHVKGLVFYLRQQAHQSEK